MLREVCLLVIIVNMYLFNVISCTECVANDSAIIKFVCNVYKFKKSVINFFNTKAWHFERKRLIVKTGLIKIYEDLSNDTDDTVLVKNKTSSDSEGDGEAPLPRTVIHLESTDSKVKGMNTEELIAAHGYTAESHNINAEDGYILTIYRIVPTSKAYNTHRFEKGSVLLHHGLLGSSEDWLLLDTGSTLPSLLMKRGYDVWLLNARGNKYTSVPSVVYRRRYTFRDYSWHEMGIYDLPPTISYISSYTNSANLYYIGHSMGASALLVLLSTVPEYNNKLKSAVLLAPLAFMSHSKGPLRYFTDFPNSTDTYIKTGEFPTEIRDKFCQGSLRSCSNSLLFMTNGGKEIWDYDLMENILSHVPAGGSTKTVAHYMQLIKSGHFRMFDHGLIANVQKYNTTYPPDYNLSAISLPISVLSGSGDWISSMPDAITLISKLKNAKTFHVVRKDNFSHLDFLWSKESPQLVYNIVMDIIESKSKVNINELNSLNTFLSTMDDLVTEEN